MSIEWLNRLSDRAILLVLLAIGLATSGISFIFNVVNENGLRGEWLEGWFQNFSTEMFGAFLGFWLLGIIVDRRRQAEAKQETREELKKRLIREMRSKDNARAVNAVEELAAHGWLHDGALYKAYLDGANLQEADLDTANLQAANLMRANLQDADLTNANLRETNLRNAKLKGTGLWYADLHGAILSGVDLQETDMEGVTFDEETRLPDDDPSGKRSFWASGTDMRRFTDPNHPNFWRSDDPKSPAYRGKTEDGGETV